VVLTIQVRMRGMVPAWVKHVRRVRRVYVVLGIGLERWWSEKRVGEERAACERWVVTLGGGSTRNVAVTAVITADRRRYGPRHVSLLVRLWLRMRQGSRIGRECLRMPLRQIRGNGMVSRMS
jgi:hypothetical protein